MKRYLHNISIILFVLFANLFSNAAFPIESQTLLNGKEYYQTLHKLFSEAKTSIDIVIDRISISPLEAGNPINELVDSLIEARKKGVSIRVVLEDSTSPRNFIAYRILLESGIDVYFDKLKLLINSRTIVIDSHVCVVGNTNWSSDSLKKDYTVAVILESNNMAEAIGKSISKLILAEQPPFIEEKSGGIRIPDDFLLLKKFGVKFIHERANDPFDVYFVLIKEAQENKSTQIQLDYEKLGKLLCLEKKFFREFENEEEKKEYYHRKLKEVLEALDNRYRLIEYNKAKNRVVLLNKFDIDLSKPDEKHPCFTLSRNFWDAELPYKLNLNAKYLYLISLLEVKKSVRAPYWFSNKYMLSEMYSMDISSISNGLQALEEENLIEIARAPSIKDVPKEEAKNIYRINQIVTEKEFNAKIEDIKKKYGKDITEQALEQAKELNEPRDPFIIETFIRLIQKYGYAAVRQANVDTLRYERGSNLRHISTTINLLEKEQ